MISSLNRTAITRAFQAIVMLSLSYNTCANEELEDPKLTEIWEPEPKIVSPAPVPSDAIVLLGKEQASKWQHGDGREVEWPVKNGVMTVKPGTKGIKTKERFCDVQLHVEWRTPSPSNNKEGQQRGNSGIFLQGRYEVQVLNSFENRTYSNGQAGSIYKQSAPLVNASKPPMEWQSYDIIFNAPQFNDSGELTKAATVTVLHNGVLIQNHFEIQGSTTYRGQPAYHKAHGCDAIFLQDHGSQVSYRNIWVRRLQS